MPGPVARIVLDAITVTLDAQPQRSSTTIASAGAYAVVVATALPDLGVTLTSAYLGDMSGDTAASHLTIARPTGALLAQRMLPGVQPGETHARVCVLDHVAELQSTLASVIDDVDQVAIDVSPDALQRAASSWQTAR